MFRSQFWHIFLTTFLWWPSSILLGQSRSFPEGWLGTWQGTLHIYHSSRLEQNVAMQLRIGPRSDGGFDWRIHYGPESDSSGLRDYILYPDKDSIGLWKIDEQNGIILQGQTFHHTFISNYTVPGSRISASYEWQGDSIIFSLFAVKEDASMTTGDTTINGAIIPPVTTHEVTAMQRAILTKMQ